MSKVSRSYSKGREYFKGLEQTGCMHPGKRSSAS